MVCRSPGNPNCLGSPTESSLAVHSGLSGTGVDTRSHSSLPGAEPRRKYSRGWSHRICIPDRMTNTIKNRLKKWVHPDHAGMPGLTPAGTTVPG